MSDRLKYFFDGPLSLSPVAYQKALKETLLTPVPLSQMPYPEPFPIGSLPVLRRRTEKEESEFKHVHKKDVAAFGELDTKEAEHESFFNKAPNLSPVAYQKALSDSLLKPVPLANLPIADNSPFEHFASLARKTGAPTSNFFPESGDQLALTGLERPQTKTTPWVPVSHGAECPDGCHVENTKATDNYSAFFQDQSKVWNDQDLEEKEDIRKLVEYARKLDANETLTAPTDPNDDEPTLTLSSKNERGIKYNAAPGSNSVEKSKTDSRGIKFKPSILNKKYGPPDREDKEGLHQFTLRTLYAEREGELTVGRVETDEFSGPGFLAKAGGKAGFLDWKNQWKLFQESQAPTEFTADARAVDVNAEVELVGTYDTAKGEAAGSGKLSGNFTLLSVKLGGKQCIVPARSVDAACKSDWMNWAMPDKLCEAIKTGDYNWGVCMGAEVEPSVGVGGEIGYEGKAGRSGFRFKPTVGAQFGPGVKGSIEIEGKKF